MAGAASENAAFLELEGRIVVKPRDSEQGRGITVDVTTEEQLVNAIKVAKRFHPDVILEQFIEGHDVRLIVIDSQVVAVAERRPPSIIGNGQNTVRQLIERLSRRRSAATGGESRIPIDQETERCVALAGYDLASVLPLNDVVFVRKTANLHTGGTIHDITDIVSPLVRKAASEAARVLGIPVVGLDFMMPTLTGD